MSYTASYTVTIAEDYRQMAEAATKEFLPIEIDDRFLNSTNEDIICTETHSLSTNVLASFQEHARCYHEPESYPDLHHHASLLLSSHLYLAPLRPKIQRILDIGAGTGIWAIEMGHTFPATEVIGTDIAPVHIAPGVPSNVKFEVHDFNAEWEFEEVGYDYIHARQLGGSIKSLPHFFFQALKTLKPGARLEIVQSQLDGLQSDDGTYNDKTALYSYFTTLVKCSEASGVQFKDVAEIKKGMEEAGFVEVDVIALKQPWGCWPRDRQLKKVGAATVLVVERQLEATLLQLFSKIGGKTEEETKKLCGDAVEEIVTGRVHGWSWVWHVVGRKPEEKKEGLGRKVKAAFRRSLS